MKISKIHKRTHFFSHLKHGSLFFFTISLLNSAYLYSQNSNFVFVDASANVDTLTQMHHEASGPAWGDFNNDDYQDLYLATFSENTLFKNNGDGTFTDVTLSAGVSDSTKSKAATWGDIDNDGFLDLYISNDRDKSNKFFYNNGNGAFTEISASAGVNDSSFSQGGAWADYDRDGKLDFLLLQDDAENILFRNQGGLNFTNVAANAGLDNEWAAYGLTWIDYNDDNNSDLFVANCSNKFGTSWTNLLYRNNGDGSFTDVSAATGVDYFGPSWGAIAFDFDNDLDMDILIANTNPQKTLLLYQNQNGVFIDVAEQIGLENIGNAFGVTSGDYDNDGDIDFLVVGLNPASRLYQNLGDGMFVDASDWVQFPDVQAPLFSGTATADYDNDGFLDFVINDENSRAYLFHNQPPDSVADNSWIIIKLKGVQSNSLGIGAKIVTVAQDLRQVRYVNAGSGLYSEDMIPVHFGFGTRTVLDSVIVRWPSDVVDLFTNVQTKQILNIEEGGLATTVSEEQAPKLFQLRQNYPNPFNPFTTISYVLSEESGSSLIIYNLLGREIRRFDFGLQNVGEYQIIWDGKNLQGEEVSSGVYIYKLEVGKFVETKKMILIR